MFLKISESHEKPSFYLKHDFYVFAIVCKVFTHMADCISDLYKMRTKSNSAWYL